MKFRALITEGGTTRTVYTDAANSSDALINVAESFVKGDRGVTIIIRPVNATAEVES